MMPVAWALAAQVAVREMLGFPVNTGGLSEMTRPFSSASPLIMR